MWILALSMLGMGIIVVFSGVNIEVEQKVSLLSHFEVEQQKRNLLRIFAAPAYPFNRLFLTVMNLRNLLKRILEFINSPLTPEDFMFKQELYSILSAGLCYIIFGPKLNFIIIFALVGYLLPFFTLYNKYKRQKFQILKYLPETVDLLGLCIEAGLDFVSGVRWLVEKAEMNPFLAHLKITMNEIIMGKSKQEALRGLAERVNMPEVRSFTNTLIQAERMGTPIREAFDIISEDTRDRRVQIGEKQALTAPILMIFPLILILFVVIIIIAGPILIRFLKEGFVNM